MALFKNIILTIFFLLFANIIFAQTYQEKEIESQIIKLKKDGWKSLSVGILTSGIGASTTLTHGPLTKKEVLSGFLIFNTVGVTLDVMSFYKFSKAKKLQKELSQIRKDCSPKFY
jgi:hypothetical protein